MVKKSEKRLFPGGKDKEIDPKSSPSGGILQKITSYMSTQIKFEDLVRKSIDRVYLSK